MIDPLILGGAEAPEGEGTEEVLAPHTGEVLAVVPLASPSQVEAALSSASAARVATGELPTWRRAEILRDIAARVERDQEGMAQTISREAGKPIDLARGEVARCVETFRFASDELRCDRGDTIPLDATSRGAGKWGLTRRFGAGPVGAITPFNFPLNLVAHKVAPAVAAGCPVVLKPANKTPMTALRLGRLILEAGWPPEALSVLNLQIPYAAPLVEDDRIKVLTFTGSAQVGWSLKGRARKKRVLLELGGDGAVVVCDDMGDHPDRWDAMVRRIAFGAFAYAGQVCVSVQRVFVHRSLHDRFVEDLVAATAEVATVGPPDESGVLMSSLIDDRAADRISRVIDQAVKGGATLHCGGRVEGRRFSPMVLTEVPEGCELATEELFGPAVHVQPFDTFPEAMARVNASPYGLQAGVYTRDLEVATRAHGGLEVGCVLIGEVPTFRVDHMPYGGVKASGFGREGLRYAFEAYTEERLLVLPSGS